VALAALHSNIRVIILKMKEKEIKLLWGKSGGLCAFGACRQELSDDVTVLGEQAHIIARSEDGPRGESDLSRDERDTYKNLILLCSHHHTLIDKTSEKYPVEKLRTMKREHEEWVSRQLKIGKPWKTKLSQVHYLNIPRLSMILAMGGYRLPTGVDIDIQGDLHDYGGMQLIKIMHYFAVGINTIEPEAVDLKSIKSIDDIIGRTVGFDYNFRTKNYSNYKGKLSGNLEKDPLVYHKHGDKKWVFTIDPRWITTSTAISMFCNGTVRLSGFATIKAINGNSIICSPLVLGI
jgi:hypothetical protein